MFGRWFNFLYSMQLKCLPITIPKRDSCLRIIMYATELIVRKIGVARFKFFLKRLLVLTC